MYITHDNINYNYTIKCHIDNKATITIFNIPILHYGITVYNIVTEIFNKHFLLRQYTCIVHIKPSSINLWKCKSESKHVESVIYQVFQYSDEDNGILLYLYNTDMKTYITSNKYHPSMYPDNCNRITDNTHEIVSIQAIDKLKYWLQGNKYILRINGGINKPGTFIKSLEALVNLIFMQHNEYNDTDLYGVVMTSYDKHCLYNSTTHSLYDGLLYTYTRDQQGNRLLSYSGSISDMCCKNTPHPKIFTLF